MIVISRAQMDHFAAEQRSRFAARMAACLRGQFPDELWAVPQAELQRRVEAALVRANAYGLHSERDCCRFLNLAVAYGWDFDRQDAHAWMAAILDDETGGTPGRRLQRLVEECIHRASVAEGRRLADNVAAAGDTELLLPSKD